MFCVDFSNLDHLFCGVCTDCYERDGNVKSRESLERSGYNDTPAAGSTASHSPKDLMKKESVLLEGYNNNKRKLKTYDQSFQRYSL